MTIRSWRITPFFAWFDMWIGVYYDKKHRRLYILPLPCVGIKIQFGASEKMWKMLADVAEEIMAQDVD